MKPCPFCGKKITEDDSVFGVHFIGDSHGWVLNHFCHKHTEKLDVVLTVYGDTKEEVIERWDGRYEEHPAN